MHALSLKLGIVVVLAATCTVVLFLTRAHWWRKMNAAQIAYAGQQLPDATLYRAPDGQFLLNLHQPSTEGELFVIYPAELKVGRPNYRHFFYLPGYVYSRYVPPDVVFMDDVVKSGVDPELKINSNSIEFMLRGQRVQIATQ